MAGKRKLVATFSSSKHIKQGSITEQANSTKEPQLSGIEKNINRSINDGWHLLASAHLEYLIKNKINACSKVKGLSPNKEPIEYFFLMMPEKLVTHIVSIVNRNLAKKVGIKIIEKTNFN